MVVGSMSPPRGCALAMVTVSSVLGCATTPTVKTPSVDGSRAVVNVMAPQAPQAPSAAACDARVKSLAFGQTLTERSPGLEGVAPTNASRLASVVPGIARAGWVVEAIAAVELGDDAGARAVVVRKAPQTPSASNGGGDGAPSPDEREAYLGIATCSTERGYELASPPYLLGQGNSFEVVAVDRVNLAGRPTGSAITVHEESSVGESSARVFVLGKAGGPRDKVLPAGATVGVMAELGYVAQRYYTTVEADEATGEPGGSKTVDVERLAGTGFYPLAPNTSAFVALRLEERAVTGRVLVLALEQGFDRPFPSSLPPIERAPTFALVGRGALPTRCAEPSLRSVVRCEALAARSAKLPYAWMAGLAPTMDGALGLAAKLGIDAGSVEVLALDWQEEAAPETPSGKKGLAAFRVSP